MEQEKVRFFDWIMEKVMIGGKELRVGCVARFKDESYRKIFAFDNRSVCVGIGCSNSIIPEQLNQMFKLVDLKDILEIISYPILGQDKNGDDIRLFDLIKLHPRDSNLVIGSIGQHFLAGDSINSNNFCFVRMDRSTLIKPPKAPNVLKGILRTEDGRTYSGEFKEEVK